MDRLVAFAAGHDVTHVMGCHIEMTRTPGRDYPLGARFQPDEAPLQMTVSQLTAIRDAARSVADEPGAHAFSDFLIMNGPYKGYLTGLMTRGLLSKITRRVP
jgi:hydroxyacylglutathione hydrolase